MKKRIISLLLALILLPGLLSGKVLSADMPEEDPASVWQDTELNMEDMPGGETGLDVIMDDPAGESDFPSEKPSEAGPEEVQPPKEEQLEEEQPSEEEPLPETHPEEEELDEEIQEEEPANENDLGTDEDPEESGGDLEENTADDWKGQGTSAEPYLLGSAEDLDLLRRRVNESGEDYTDVYFLMTDDIRLPEGWEPIGCIMPGASGTGDGANLWPFTGCLDGGGHTLSVPAGGLPLLGYVRGAYVSNLSLYGEQINGDGLVFNYVVDYGSGDSFVGTVPETIRIDNVTILSGTEILRSGFIGGYASAQNQVTIQNSTVESGVVIGYTKDQDWIGSFAGEYNGTITNCVSNADVYGASFVGGIVADKGQSMGTFEVEGCTFGGTVTATGNYVGGIVGAGYGGTRWGMNSAWSTPGVTIRNCVSTGIIYGDTGVGGIFGGEGAQAQAWDNGPTYVENNSFSGTVTGNKFVGGIMGYVLSLNKNSYISGNTNSSEAKPVGGVGAIDTSAHEPGMFNGVYYFNTSTADGKTAAEIRAEVVGHQLENVITVTTLGSERYANQFKVDHNRTDDPLDDGSPAAVASLTISGEFKTEYLVGDEFDKTGITVTANYSDGSSKDVTAEAEFTGFDSKTPGEKEISVVFGGAFATFHVTVRLPEGTVTVKLSVLGDEHHDVTGPSDVHGLWVGGLTEWLPEIEVSVVNSTDEPATVWKLLNQVFDAAESLTLFARDAQYGKYIYAVQKDDLKLEEKENVPADSAYFSGWMYAVNGKHIQLAVDKCFLQEGDVVILHWCDDSNIDEAAGAQQEQQDQQAAFAVEDLIFAIPEKVTLDDEEAIAAARAAYDALTDKQKALVDEAAYNALLEAEAKLAALKLGATTVTAKNLKAGTIKLTWTAIEGAAKYNVYVSTKKGEGYKLAGTVTGKTFTYKKGSVGTRYYFKVTGVVEEGYETQESSPVSRYRLPNQVKSLKAKSTKAKQVTLTWKKVSGAKKYYIYMSKNGKTGWKKVGTATKTTFTYKKGTSGKTLYFKVQAVSSSGKKGAFSAVKKIKVK